MRHPEPSHLQMPDPMQLRLQRWQAVRTWARLIREAEALWRVDVRALHRLAAQELGQLVQEVPPRLRCRVNRWLARLGVATRLAASVAQRPVTGIKKPPPAGGGSGAPSKSLMTGETQRTEWPEELNRSGGI